METKTDSIHSKHIECIMPKKLTGHSRRLSEERSLERSPSYCTTTASSPSSRVPLIAATEIAPELRDLGTLPPATSGVGCRTSALIGWVAACVSIDSITWASDQTELKRLQKAKVFNETRSSHDAVGRASWKAGVLLRSSKNTANRPHAVKRFSQLRVLGSSKRSRTAIGLFPTEQWGPKKRHYHAWLCVNAAQSSGQQMRCAANAACVPSFLHRDHLGSAHAVGRNARGARV